MAKYLIQIVVLGTQAVGKAFAKALRQELQASQQAAAARNSGRGGRAGDSRTAAENMRLGLSVEEARQILNVKPESTSEDVQSRYDALFQMNDKSKGGSFYIQSKIYRAKERLDKDFSQAKAKESKQTNDKEEGS